MNRRTLNGRFVRSMRHQARTGDAPGTGGGGQAVGQQAGQSAGQQQGAAGQGGDNGGQASGQGGGQGSGQGSQHADLFDDLDLTDTGDGSGQGQQGQGGQDGALAPAAVQQIGQLIQSAIDRRINAVVRETRQGGQQQGQGQQGGQQQGQATQEAARPVADTGAVREARLAYREYVGDQIRFVSAVEREHAQRLATNLLHGRRNDIDDPDQVGRDVASEVAKTITDLRSHYRELTIKQAKKKGLWRDEPDPQAGAQLPGAGTSAPGLLVTGGAQMDKKMSAVKSIADEYNARQGYQTGQAG